MKKESVIILLTLILVIGISFAAFYKYIGKHRAQKDLNKTSNNHQLANPASENCIDKGGTLSIETRGDGGQYGLCNFEDDMSCEEWALYRNECPVGGVKTTGYDNIQQMYCAWLGGQTLAVKDATCTLPSGVTCPVDKLYNGTCPS